MKAEEIKLDNVALLDKQDSEDLFRYKLTTDWKIISLAELYDPDVTNKYKFYEPLDIGLCYFDRMGHDPNTRVQWRVQRIGTKRIYELRVSNVFVRVWIRKYQVKIKKVF